VFKIKQQQFMRTKLGLSLIAIAAISVAMATQAYYIQAADAQAKLPNNSVSSETIVNGQVKTDDLATDAVTSGKIKNGEVKTDDLATDAVTSGKIKNGEVKAEDIAAGVIPSGGSTPADNSVTSAKIVNGEVKTEDLASGVIPVLKFAAPRSFGVTIDPGNTGSDTVECPAGYVVTGGGFFGSSEFRVFRSDSSGDRQWTVEALNDGTTSHILAASAMCILLAP
jgi:hypothetical protein